ncbi:hypothetical protein EV681_3434 [Advenella incenata]|uniref:Uncharacterized protein n=1 Tax=Advenella incenata TaxID=267800 RepID=A0A4Q7VD38_9BURK|nr:hypothetical protein EV681_3434 [Advenella incenata]
MSGFDVFGNNTASGTGATYTSLPAISQCVNVL